MLYRRYLRVVHGVLFARLPVLEVEDHVQEVFLAALRQIGKLRDPAAFGGWLVSIARKRASEFYRVMRPVEPLSISNEPIRPAHQSSQADAGRVLEAMRALPEAYRETMMLRLVEGMSGQEIASRTGLTPASVRVNLHRGMDLLRQALGEEKPS